MFGLFPSVWFLARAHHREFLAFFLKVLRSLHVHIGGKHNVSDCGPRTELKVGRQLDSESVTH